MPSPGAPRLYCAALLAAGCGFGQLQTARTAPVGTTQVTFGHTFASSGFQNGTKDADATGATTTLPFVYFPPHLELRRGLTPNLDVGARLTFGLGFTADVKYNLLPAELPFALSISAGAGPAVALGEAGIYVLHVPLMVSASYEIGGWLTPYAGFGYRGIWMWGQDDPTQPDFNYTAPTGPGEGLLTPIGGIAVGRPEGWALLIEYGRLVTAWHDPGHGYTFVPAHLFSIAIRTGRGSPFER